MRYAENNIRVNAVAPGLTATDAIKRAFTQEQRVASASEYQPMGRMLEPSEIADAFVWVCSEEASGVTGLVVSVDGGWAAR